LGRAPGAARRDGFSRALIEDLGPRLVEDERDSLDQIILASARMSDLIDGILHLSRVSRSELNREWVDLSALAARVRLELEQGDPGRATTWEVEAGLRAWGDPRLLGALLRNLLGNAWKFSVHQPQARIGLRAEAHGFEVFDNGAGFDMAYAGKLFLPFQRLHREEEFPGMGIGLATAYRIVQRHGGTLQAQSAPGQGARFQFTLASPEPLEPPYDA
jgi:signal transduction histidine kinase